MNLLQAIVLAVVQGISEFLPISSSGHLILVPRFLGWPDQGLAFDVAVHVGTLLAVLVYFRESLLAMGRAWFASVFRRAPSRDSRLAWQLLVATIPVALVGLLFNDYIEHELRRPVFVAATLAIFGVLMYAVDRVARSGRDEYALSWPQALLIGAAQSLALMPGTSRSGITITAGRLSGLTRSAAARFSFLLAVPGIAAAGGYEGYKLVTGGAPVDWLPMLVGLAGSALSGIVCIHVMIRFIERIGLLPFTVYRLLIALVIVLVAV
jgi:undecaprenyl-diphosphatase